MTPAWWRDTVTLLRAASLSQDAIVPDWTSFTATSVGSCHAQPMRNRAAQDDDDVIERQRQLFLPPDVDIRAQDRVVLGDATYEVRGEPEPWRGATGRLDHVRALLERREFTFTTLVTLLLPAARDAAYGDPRDSNAAAVTGVPARITHQGSSRYTPDKGDMAVTDTYGARLLSGTYVTVDMRVRDEVTGVTYTIDEISNDRPLYKGDAADVLLVIKRVS